MKSIIMLIIVGIMFPISTFANVDKDGFSPEQYFIDSAQMLTEVLYVMEKTGRFDIAEQQILNNVKIGKIPKELESISKRIIDTCHQGKIALEARNDADGEAEIEYMGVGIKAGFKLGAAIGLEDPVSAIWSIYQGVAEFSSVTSRKNQKIRSILRQLKYRIDSDKYDLRNRVTEHAEKYNVDPKKIISFDSLKEIEKYAKDFPKKPDIITSFINAYPFYTKLKYYATKYGDTQYWEEALKSKNSILIVDQDRLNIAAELGNRVIYRFLKNSQTIQQKSIHSSVLVLKKLSEYGFQNGGHAYGVFYFLRGVTNSLAEYYKLPRPTRHDIWSDLTYAKPMDEQEHLDIQSIWCANWLAANFSNYKSKELSSLIETALKTWRPGFVMQAGPFARHPDAHEIYKTCLAVKWEWNVYWGIFDDDIIIYNNSSFPLTDVKLRVKLKRKETDETVWEKEISCSYVGVGKSYTWVDVMSIKNGNHDTISGTATLNCNEDNVVNLEPYVEIASLNE